MWFNCALVLSCSLGIIAGLATGQRVDESHEDDVARAEEQQPIIKHNHVDTLEPNEHQSIENPTYNNHAITVIVSGRSGSGVTSTIRNLIGPKTKCSGPKEKSSKLSTITEYTITNIPSSSKQPINYNNNYTLKLIDLPGFVDGRTLKADARILATLKSYIIQAGPPGPQFFLSLSRFDDNRIFGEHSLFVQFIKRLELFEKVFLDSVFTNRRIPFLFVLTHLMSETRSNQRRPDGKLDTFKRSIDEFARFSSPVQLVVGENKGVGEYNLKVKGGWVKLPNKEFYPKNVFESMIKMNRGVHDHDNELIQAYVDGREVEMNCEAKTVSADDWEGYEEDVDAFEYLLSAGNYTVELNSINRQLDAASLASHKHPQKQFEEVVQKTALQVYLQNNGFDRFDSLPQKNLDKAAFFQRSTLVSSLIPALMLSDAFNLTMPEFTDSLAVGYGYALMADALSPNSPFELSSYLPSSVGYQLPSFMRCRKFPRQEVDVYASFSSNMTTYFEERLRTLEFPGKANVSLDSFSGMVKEGFNIPPEEGSPFVSLTGVKEVHVLKCEMSSSRFWELSYEFMDDVDELTPFSSSDKDSVNEWVNFFNKWGSHVVTKGFGGGRIHGSVIRNNDGHSRNVESTLESIFRFGGAADKPSYRFFGGELGANSTELLRDMGSLSEQQRDEILSGWRDSLGSKFIMLSNKLELKPISWVVGEKMGAEKRDMVEHASLLYLSGGLKYVGSSRKKNGHHYGKKRVNDDVTGSLNHDDNDGTTEHHVNHHDSQDSSAQVIPSSSLPGSTITNDYDSLPDSDIMNQLTPSPSRTNYINSYAQSQPYSFSPYSSNHHHHHEHQSQESSSFNHHDQDDLTTAVLQTDMNNTRISLHVYNHTIQSIQKQHDLEHNLQQAELNKIYSKRIKQSEDKYALLSQQEIQKRSSMNMTYSSRLENIRRRSRVEQQEFQKLMQQLNATKESEERQHQLFMDMLKKKRQEEEEARLRRKKENECSWYACAWNYLAKLI